MLRRPPHHGPFTGTAAPRGYEEPQLTLVGIVSLADQVPWNPMFVYEVPAVMEPS